MYILELNHKHYANEFNSMKTERKENNVRVAL